LAIPEKVTLSTRILLPPDDDTNPLNITYLSAATFPLALPPIVAKGFGWPGVFGVEGVNARVGKWLLALLAGESDEREYSPKIVGKVKAKAKAVVLPSGKSIETTSDTASLFADTAETVHGTTSEEPRLRGWVFLDYFKEPDEGLLPLLVECNWRGRKGGSEGWPSS
jgi:1-phosphatidylinositol phosphodiesterase